jgi:hypothetical protein
MKLLRTGQEGVDQGNQVDFYPVKVALRGNAHPIELSLFSRAGLQTPHSDFSFFLRLRKLAPLVAGVFGKVWQLLKVWPYACFQGLLRKVVLKM